MPEEGSPDWIEDLDNSDEKTDPISEDDED
jgi:hypothetical protein